MKIISKKIATLMLSLAALAVVFSVFEISAQAQPVTQKSITVYLRAKATPTSTKIEISNLAETDLFDASSVTSSKPGVVSVQKVKENNLTDKSYNYEYSEAYSEYSGSAWIELMCNKAGTSVISYKINDVTYTTTVKVLKYTNALKTLKITGLEGGKNQASEYKNHHLVPYLLDKTIKKPVLTVAAKKNWKIKQITLITYKGIGRTAYPLSFSSVNYNYGVSKAVLRLSPLKAKNGAEIEITMQNKKNPGTIVYYCYINYGAE